MPQPFTEPWPFYDVEIEEHVDLRRYLFLAAVRAARLHLHLSYAELDHEGSYRASPYLSDIQKAIDWVARSTKNRSSRSQPPVNRSCDLHSSGEPTTPFVSSSYTVHELSHHAICPRRFLLQRLGDSGSMYRESFHVRLLAEAVWADLAFSHLEAGGVQTNDKDATIDAIATALDQTKPAAEVLLPGLRPLDWYSARQSLDGSVRFSANQTKHWGKLDEYGARFGDAEVGL